MGGIGQVLGAIAGAGRGYEAANGRPVAGPNPQQQNNGLLMKYLNRRRQPVGTQMPPGSPAGLPDGSMPPPMPASPDAGTAPQIPINPSAAPSAFRPGIPAAPAPNRVQNPFGEPPNNPPSPPAFGQGTVVDRPTTAILGEDGPEAVIPLNGRPDAKVSTANLPRMNYRRGY